MIISGNGNKYIWIKVPKTATLSYERFFELYNENPAVTNVLGVPIHTHTSFLEYKKVYGSDIPFVAVVRHPVERFVSSLKYLKKLKDACKSTPCPFGQRHHKCDVHGFKEFYTSTEICVEFLQQHFTYNCGLKNLPSVEEGRRYHLDKIFDVVDLNFISSFFITQTEFCYNPKTKIFRFENLSEFDTWIETELGYDVSRLEHLNDTKGVELNIDIEQPEFVKTVEMMFYDDFKAFNYPMKYLT
jgi:hypothetical protein